jgi:hypothetical protein
VLHECSLNGAFTTFENVDHFCAAGGLRSVAPATGLRHSMIRSHEPENGMMNSQAQRQRCHGALLRQETIKPRDLVPAWLEIKVTYPQKSRLHSPGLFLLDNSSGSFAKFAQSAAPRLC